MAYVLSSIYWGDLLRTRRLGRRLAEALLGKAEAVGSGLVLVSGGLVLTVCRF